MHRLHLLAFFAVAACDNSPKVYGPTYDGGDAASANDGAPDAVEESAPPVDASEEDVANDAPACSSTVAILGGNATTLFGAAAPGGSPLSAASLPGSLFDCGAGCSDPIAIARFGTSLFAVLATTSGALDSTSMTTSWADPAAVASASTRDGPALAAIGGTAHLVYQAADYKYYHAQYTGSSWDAADDPVGGTTTQSFGARAPSAAAAGSDLVLVQAGSDNYLYDQTWNGSWQAAHQQGGAAVQNSLSPTIASLSGGNSDLLAAYLRLNDYKVMTVARTSGTWGTPMLVDANAYSNDPVAVGALPGGKALVMFRGSDDKPYFSAWDGATTWSAPAPVVSSNNPVIASTPSIAAGVCGADALVAFAESGGGVAIVPFTGGAFGAPVAVAGTSGAKFVAIGTLP